MNWLEKIKLQAGPAQRAEVEEKLASLSCSIRIRPPTGLARIFVCRHASIPGCFGIHLLWNSKQPVLGGSQVGLNLIQTLKTHGLIDHSIWTVEEPEYSEPIQGGMP